MDHTLVLAPFDADEAHRLSKFMTVKFESWFSTGRLYDPDELAQRINEEGITHLIVEADFVFSDTMSQTPTLRFVGLCRNAVNQVDVDDATARGILVVNTPGRNAVAVAELTVGMILSLARRIPSADRYVRAGRWADPTSAYGEFRGTELAGKIAGIIGFGAIGRMVAQRLLAFDMRVIAFDPYVPGEAIRGLHAEPRALDALLAEADFVLVHAPPSPTTIGMIGKAQLDHMKPSAYLVNTSAPGVCDEAALSEALEAHRIAGAALDVFDGQPLPPSSPLLRLDNVILTPHIGGSTSETIQRYSRMAVDDILAVESGLKPERLVNPAAWDTRRRVPAERDTK